MIKPWGFGNIIFQNASKSSFNLIDLEAVNNEAPILILWGLSWYDNKNVSNLP